MRSYRRAAWGQAQLRAPWHQEREHEVIRVEVVHFPYVCGRWRESCGHPPGNNSAFALSLGEGDVRSVKRFHASGQLQGGRDQQERPQGSGIHVTANVRAKRATAAGRQARAGENVHRTAGSGLVVCRWCSA